MKVAVADYYYEKVELPSRGRFYENLKEVHLRPMTGVEQDILTTERLIKEGKALDMVLSNCLREKVDIEELLVADYMYLLFKLRVLTYGDEYRFEMKCPQCGAINDVEIVLNVEEGVREGDIESEPLLSFRRTYHVMVALLFRSNSLLLPPSFILLHLVQALAN